MINRGRKIKEKEQKKQEPRDYEVRRRRKKRRFWIFSLRSAFFTYRTVVALQSLCIINSQARGCQSVSHPFLFFSFFFWNSGFGKMTHPFIHSRDINWNVSCFRMHAERFELSKVIEKGNIQDNFLFFRHCFRKFAFVQYGKTGGSQHMSPALRCRYVCKQVVNTVPWEYHHHRINS